MLAGVNGDSCTYYCKRAISYGSALIGITLLVIGILAAAKCAPFASFAHSSAMGGGCIVAGFIILSLSAYYIFGNCCKSPEVYVQHLPPSQPQKEHRGVLLLQKFLERKIDLLQREEFVGSIDTYRMSMPSKSIEQFQDNPTLVPFINNTSSCALYIPYKISNNGEKCILIVFIERVATRGRWSAHFKTNAGFQVMNVKDIKTIKSLIKALHKNKSYTIGTITYQPF